ncbi:MAG: 4Fe-4S cluster-binding domain-containing protein [Anaerolineales bacterium]|nr:4Fe-4S cluster-binding domain-containing protein [Anaerolineales bacterium]
MNKFMPAYLQLLAAGELEKRVSQAYEILHRCDLCGWDCKVDRLAGKLGACRTAAIAMVSSFGPHHGEESPLSGYYGSGTIFFTRCNLHCQFCQNHDISQTDRGSEVDAQTLANIMLQLQEMGCHNINFVSPTHVVPQILAALLIAAQDGLHLPLVYNTGGYDSKSALALLDGVIDIYMPDMKYSNAQIALRYSKIRQYPQINRSAVLEMHRQVGDLQMDERGIAYRGLLVRLLVLPFGLAGTQETVKFLATKVSTQTYLNVMDQYHPVFNASQYPKLNRRIQRQEYEHAILLAHEAGLFRLDGMI